MKNYGEELVYWYFRLNGFIPMTDLVLHSNELRKASDCDLMAVRYPHVFEEVGGQPDDWDNELLERLGYDGRKTLAVFIQVKTGESGGDDVDGITEYFNRHCDYLVRRLGFWPPNEAEEHARRFCEAPSYSFGDLVLSKVVIIRDMPRRQRPPPWVEFSLDRTLRFINDRMEKYRPEKHRDRMFFPDSIIQFLADKCHHEERIYFTKDAKP